jgi:hypothetical protein
MSPQRKAIGASLTTIFLALCGPPSARAAEWPQIYGEAGSYSGKATPDEIRDLASLGFHLHVGPGSSWRVDSKLLQAMTATRSRYIDAQAWRIIRKVCGIPAAGKRCELSEARTRAVLAELKTYLEETADSPHIAGYWVLDDNPGADIRSVLDEAHKLVQEANARAHIPKPTVCGFGGRLDLLADTQPPAVRYGSLNRALTNYSPAACDIVALYPYSSARIGTSPDAVDWSLRRLLPYFFEELRRRGWSAEAQPFIGMPQAFYYDPKPPLRVATVPVRSQDIATQMRAYCEAGAISILFYTWHDSNEAWHEGHNTPLIRDGLRDGLRDCRAIWAARKPDK